MGQFNESLASVCVHNCIGFLASEMSSQIPDPEREEIWPLDVTQIMVNDCSVSALVNDLNEGG